LLSNVLYRSQSPVPLNIVISCRGDSVWFLGTSFSDAEQTVAWYKKRFWIEMFRDLKSTLGFRQARLLLGYQLPI